MTNQNINFNVQNFWNQVKFNLYPYPPILFKDLNCSGVRHSMEIMFRLPNQLTKFYSQYSTVSSNWMVLRFINSALLCDYGQS